MPCSCGVCTRLQTASPTLPVPSHIASPPPRALGAMRNVLGSQSSSRRRRQKNPRLQLHSVWDVDDGRSPPLTPPLSLGRRRKPQIQTLGAEPTFPCAWGQPCYSVPREKRVTSCASCEVSSLGPSDKHHQSGWPREETPRAPSGIALGRSCWSCPKPMMLV